ncbi:S8 family peptidase [Noviluteimonas gilva]|uniref:S8 family serine peptidase n=1 Tax=Noviluteimonas gilva TaxID=2682097 RepID=A0A7C9LLW3_9GAMM|nr:S8 family peptidase [Lysobacter gilvus]MUV14584.1 S8 family serine peptidase [Lysobacter gilvus]
MPEPRNPRPHFVLPETFVSTEPYQAVNAFGRSGLIPPRYRPAHAAELRGDLEVLEHLFPVASEQQRAAGWQEGLGLRVVFSSFPDVQLAIDSLDLKSAGIELLNVRESEGVTLATVWIPEGQLELFERKITAYLAAPGAAATVQDNRKLLDAIREIRAAAIEDLWTDEAPIPADDRVATFEAWFSTPVIPLVATGRNALRLTATERIERFRAVAEQVELRVSQRALQFPERAVLQVRGTIAQFKDSANLLGQLAELRLAPEPAEFFMELNPEQQRDWVDELIPRTQFAQPNEDVPYVCVLDTGCTQGHPLIAASLSADDVHTVDADWGAGDEDGHGTAQSGLALWGDLSIALSGVDRIRIAHRLESVKLLPDEGANDEEHFGPLTAEAVSRPEIHAPHRRRLFSMAVTSDTHVMTGRPTAWSAEVDALASDWSGNGEAPRLMILSGGNVVGIKPGGYFATNSGSPIEDPANAWNAVTVGAITAKVDITEPYADAYDPVAPSGGLSPYSSTSFTWDREAPFKPDVVFEGGNMGDDGMLCSQMDSLSLLTTHHRPINRQFATTWATSAATALASRFAAQVMAEYPALWPETVRALMVHSAQWTPALQAQFPGGRDNIERRLRHCGWGEPDLASALHSGSDSLTLIAQAELQPYGRRRPRASITAHDMRLHRLPWPRDALQALLETDVELRVSLSYFIEPNPGQRGRSDRFRYASHGLRFAVQRPAETVGQFQRRINALAREDDEAFERFEGADPRWLLGPRKRFRGSLHHDRLTCSAPELASREHIAVFPVGGWWKSREALQRFERTARYSLVVSIHAPQLPTEVDLYVGVEQALQVAVPIEIPV